MAPVSPLCRLADMSSGRPGRGSPLPESLQPGGAALAAQRGLVANDPAGGASRWSSRPALACLRVKLGAGRQQLGSPRFPAPGWSEFSCCSPGGKAIADGRRTSQRKYLHTDHIWRTSNSAPPSVTDDESATRPASKAEWREQLGTARPYQETDTPEEHPPLRTSIRDTTSATLQTCPHQTKHLAHPTSRPARPSLHRVPPTGAGDGTDALATRQSMTPCAPQAPYPQTQPAAARQTPRTHCALRNQANHPEGAANLFIRTHPHPNSPNHQNPQPRSSASATQA